MRALRPEIMVADPPGLSSCNLEIFQRTKATRPLWPYVRTVTYENDMMAARPKVLRRTSRL